VVRVFAGFVAGFLALATSASGVASPARSAPTGTLIAAFITKAEILLCSDGRAVNSLDGKVISDEWPKVHRLSARAGLLTAGRSLPGLTRRIETKLGDSTSVPVTEVVDVVRASLAEEWAILFPTPPKPADESRVFVFVGGFDSRNEPRLFQIDSRSGFLVEEARVLTDGHELEIHAMSTGSGIDERPSETIVKYLNLQTRRTDFNAWLLGGFNQTKDELARTNAKIGGRTFAATIGAASGFREVTGGTDRNK
jgi:hypothetical protein